MLPREFHFYVKGLAIRNTVAPDISLAVVADTDDTAVFREELAHRMITSDAAVFTQSSYDFVL